MPDPSGKPDSHDPASYARLLTANHRRLYAFALALVANRADAEDVMQDASGVLWEKFATYEPGTDFARWAMAVIRIIAMRHRRAKSRQTALPLSDQVLDRLAEEAAAMSDQFEVRHAALGDCLSKLSEQDRRHIAWRYEDARPVNDVAEQLGVSSAAVYKALSRIHESLLRCIRRTLVEWGER